MAHRTAPRLWVLFLALPACRSGDANIPRTEAPGPPQEVRPLAEAEPAPSEAEADSTAAARDRRVTRTEFDARWIEDCAAVTDAGDNCRENTDLDRNGADDAVFEVRARDGSAVGLAVAWAEGDVSLLSAGTRVRVTDVYEDGVDEDDGALSDLAGLMQWRIVPRRDGGFVDPVRGRVFPAVDPTGTGIWMTGGDAAEILYWDGQGFRELLLGF